MFSKLSTAIVLVSVLLLNACGGSPAPLSGTATNTPQATAYVEESDAKPVAATEEAQPTAEPVPTEADIPTENEADTATPDISQLSHNLDALSSYRAHFTFSIDGKDGQGKPQKGNMEFLQEVIKDPQDQHIRITATGDIAQNSADSGAFEMFKVADTTYIFSPENATQKCVAVVSSVADTPTGDMFNPDSMIGGFKNAQLVSKGEPVNGVRTDHYAFTQEDLLNKNFTSAKGDVWLAQDGGYIVKYVGSATGKDNLGADNFAEGTITWEYNIEAANQLTSIELPLECANAKPSSDLPIPDNATEKNIFGKIITFKSADESATIAAFYADAMPKQGWTAGASNAMGDTQVLTFTKDERAVSITITKDASSGDTTVIVSEQ